MNRPNPALPALVSALLAVTTMCPAQENTNTKTTNSWSAEIRTRDPWLRSFVKSNHVEVVIPDYLIDVTFPESVPTAECMRPDAYQLTILGRPDKAIPVVVIGDKPLPEKPDLTTPLERGKIERVTNAVGVTLSPAQRLNPQGDYQLEIKFQKLSSGIIKVEKAPKPQASESKTEGKRILEFAEELFGGRVHLSLDARTPFSANNGLAVDYKASYELPLKPYPRQDSLTLQSAALESEGTVKLDSSDKNVSDELSLNGNYQLLWIYELKDPTLEQGQLGYYWGFRLKAFELEADQKFRVVNWTVKPQLAAWVPYSNIPGLWWSRKIGISGNAATPLFVFVGYSHVEILDKNANVVDPKMQTSDRLEFELAYAVPLTSNFRVGTRARFFRLFEVGQWKDYEEIFVQRYLNNSKSISVKLKYTNGAVPPKFDTGAAVSAGFSVEY